MKTRLLLATAAALALSVAAPPAAEAVQSDLVKVCVDRHGRQSAVRYIAGRQKCTGGRKTLFIDRPGYSPRDFAVRPSDEIDECTVADAFTDSRENEITLCVGLQEVGPAGNTVLRCSIWLDGAEEYLVVPIGVAPTNVDPASFLATPEGNNIFASIQQATEGSGGGAAREMTFFHPVDGYVIEVDLEFLIWPIEGDCLAVGRASNAPLSSRD